MKLQEDVSKKEKKKKDTISIISNNMMVKIWFLKIVVQGRNGWELPCCYLMIYR